MDVSYHPYAERARRKIKSATTLNHLTLAPLTSKLPLHDDELKLFDASPLPPNTSYLQGRSAPSTPRLLASSARTPRSRSGSLHRPPASAATAAAAAAALQVPATTSRSSQRMPSSGHSRKRSTASGSTTPRRRHPHATAAEDDDDGADEDWLLRTGAMMAVEAREYKGQGWLVSRQSSTSLVGARSAEEEAFERDLVREREAASRRASRRGSAADDGISLSLAGSRAPSRMRSRSRSVAGAHPLPLPLPLALPAAVALALEQGGPDDGFSLRGGAFLEPDFVDLDRRLEKLERDSLEDDEADIKRLMRRNGQGRGGGSWIANMIGWSLFSVQEHGDDESDGDESDEESLAEGGGGGGSGGGGARRLSSTHGDYDYDAGGLSRDGRSGWLKRHCEGPLDPEELIAPPETNQGGWSDAAWLLSVATKVIF